MHKKFYIAHKTYIYTHIACKYIYKGYKLDVLTYICFKINIMKGRRYLDELPYPYPHIGNMVHKVIKQKRFTKAEVARRMNVSPTIMARYLKNQSIQYGILWKFCVVLNYDFLSDLEEYYPKELPKKINTEIAILQKKIESLESEIEIYKGLLKR